jgi:succinate-semialdehyde dehydrogenase/glutarate-semialdehyde dehydrogenase/aspartate-semialdehyde dehydrogenase
MPLNSANAGDVGLADPRQLSRRALKLLRRKDLLLSDAYIAGGWVSSTQTLPVLDPATQERIGAVAACNRDSVDGAVAAAMNAFKSWRACLPLDRGRLLRAWSTLIRENASDLAVIMVAEQGKPLSEALDEIEYGASFLDWFAAEGERAYGITIPSHKPGSRLSVSLQPVGVVVAVTPWNFPIAMITRKAGAALAAGCTIIVKPASETPFSALALAKLAEEAGLPAGVFQVIPGDGPLLVSRLLEHSSVRAFSFTGSTEVGRGLLEKAARTVKKVSMELGGHAPFLVFSDASIDRAVEGCIAAKFATSAQDCLAANRIYVQEGAYGEFVTAFGRAAERLSVGHGLMSQTDIGPMTKASGAEKCREHIRDALLRGARLVTGGPDHPLGGNFVRPTVLAEVTDDMLIAREETFGPVAAVLSFRTEGEVIARANRSEMGLAAYVYTKDLACAMRTTDQLEYGMVGVNTPSFTGAPIPFGGWKQSGLGREGSKDGLLDYMEQKYVCIGGLGAA